METTNGNNEFGKNSEFDESNNQDSSYDGIGTNAARKEARNPETSDDDFLSGDNAKKMYPNNQNNPNSEYNEKATMSSGRNPNIGGDESEYETSTSDANSYEEESLADNNDGFADRKDSEEINNHDEPTKYKTPTSQNTSEE